MQYLLYMTALGSVFTLLLTLFKPVLVKKYGGVWYYYSWVLVLVVLCIPYKIDIFQYSKRTVEQNISSSPAHYAAIEIPDKYFSLDISEAPISTSFTSDSIGAIVPKKLNVQIKDVLLIAYSLGFVLIGAYFFVQYYVFRKRLLNSTTVIEEAETINIFTEKCSSKGVNKKIKLLKSPAASFPMLVGLFKPAIILPEKAYKKADLEMIFEHELTHVFRGDIAYKTLALFVNVVHWFNPIVYLAVKQINEACEYACDETVTRTMDGEVKKEYGKMLIMQVASSLHKPQFYVGLAESGSSKNILKRRISIIMNSKKYKRVAISIVAVAILIVSANFFGLKSINAKTAEQVETEPPELITEISVGTEQRTKPTEAAEETEAASLQVSEPPVLTEHKDDIKSNVEIRNKLDEYLAEAITADEIKVLNNYLDNLNSMKHNASIETRELTKEETNRRLILLDSYELDGVRPKTPLSTTPDAEFYLDITTDTYHYPDRQLTDEELLQHIDWAAKVNYVIDLRNLENEDLPKPTEKPELNVTNEEAVLMAKEEVLKVFDVDVSGYVSDVYATVFVEPKTDSIAGTLMQVVFRPYRARTMRANGESFSEYAVGINGKSKEITSCKTSLDGKNTMSITEEEAKIILGNSSKWIDAAKAIFYDKDVDLSGSSITLDLKGNGLAIKRVNGELKQVPYNTAYGIVDVVFQVNGTKKTVSLSFPDRDFIGISYE